MEDVPDTDRWLDRGNPADEPPKCPCSFYVGRCKCEGEDCPHCLAGEDGKPYCNINAERWED